MISEPELVGDDGEIPRPAAAHADPAVSSDALDDEDAPPEPLALPRGRRPWLWAAGGALAASVVWAGVLYEVNERPPTDLKGYSLPDDLCTKAELRRLGAKYGAPRPQHRAMREDPAMDRAWCDVQLGGLKHGAVNYELSVELVLHKKSDPQPEFEVLATQSDWEPGDGVVDFREVDGLGERAVFVHDDTYGTPQLAVLDGGVVIRMTLFHSYEWKEGESDAATGQPDYKGVQAILAADMKALMAALKE
ncbi:hypothetical protein ACIBI4_10230 [Streptomyces sp. NPDC050418]|uniref:hypothetical protein n=1 Tax=Streptomyces sp. NPDC050418 TaxID=3365612 RepID=UPI0037AC6D4E